MTESKERPAKKKKVVELRLEDFKPNTKLINVESGLRNAPSTSISVSCNTEKVVQKSISPSKAKFIELRYENLHIPENTLKVKECASNTQLTSASPKTISKVTDKFAEISRNKRQFIELRLENLQSTSKNLKMNTLNITPITEQLKTVRLSHIAEVHNHENVIRQSC